MILQNHEQKGLTSKKGWTYYGHEEVGQYMIRDIAKRMKISNELETIS